jgi:hypothetical protein
MANYLIEVGQKARKCLACPNEVIGRVDKVFCSIKCKNYYHKKLRYKSVIAAIRINEYLKRNHGILLEALGKNVLQKKVYRNALEDKRFRFKYHTHTHLNSQGKTMHYVYDLGWMEFSNDEVLVVRSK